MGSPLHGKKNGLCKKETILRYLLPAGEAGEAAGKWVVGREGNSCLSVQAILKSAEISACSGFMGPREGKGG